jgi:hypothetical protein
MISKKDIFIGARIIENDPEHQGQLNFKGTVQSIISKGDGEYDYTVAVLPDNEFMQMPGIKDNCYFGLTFCLGFHIDLLPIQEISQNCSHILQKFKINIKLKVSEEIKSNRTGDFYDELVRMLTVYGYNIDVKKDTFTAPEARKGKKRIYCHPIQLAGECPPSEFNEIEKMIRHGSTYEIHSIKTSDLMFDYSQEEELEQYHVKYDNIIQTMLLDAFRTETPNIYKDTRQVIELLSKRIKIITVSNYCWSGDGSASTQYIKSAYNLLLNDHKISISPNNSNLSHTKENTK